MSASLTSLLAAAGILGASFALGWGLGAEGPAPPEDHSEAITAELRALREQVEALQAGQAALSAAGAGVSRPGRQPLEAATEPEPRTKDPAGGALRRADFEEILERLAMIELKLDIAGLGEPGLAAARDISPHPNFGAVESFIRRYRDFDNHGYPPQEYRLKSKRQIVQEFGTPNGDVNDTFWSYLSQQVDADGNPVYKLWFRFADDGHLNFCGIELEEGSGF